MKAGRDPDRAATPDCPLLAGWQERTLEEDGQRVDQLIAEVGPSAACTSAVAWCSSGDPAVQSIGLDVLGVLGVNDDDARTQLMAAAQRLGASDDADVRWWVALALGQNSTDGRSTALLLHLAADPDDDVRFQAVSGLGVPADDEPDDGGPVAAALMAALEDRIPEIRDWAAFGLGVLREVDSPEIREALLRCLTDPEADTAGEAAVGLARRQDTRVFPLLCRALADPEVGNLWVETAAALGDVRLLPALQRLKDGGWQQDDEPRPEVLDEALATCSATVP